MNTTNEPRKQGPPWHPGPQCGCWSCRYRFHYADCKAELTDRVPAANALDSDELERCWRWTDSMDGWGDPQPARSWSALSATHS
jgi:hypothetical protein